MTYEQHAPDALNLRIYRARFVIYRGKDRDSLKVAIINCRDLTQARAIADKQRADLQRERGHRVVLLSVEPVSTLQAQQMVHATVLEPFLIETVQ